MKTPWIAIGLVRGHAAGRLLSVTLMAALLAAAGAAQQPPAPSLPDSPSAAPSVQHKSVGKTLGAIAKTIGDDEWTMMKAPFETQGLGFDSGTPFRNATLYWNAAVLTGTGILIANDESVAAQVNPAWHQTSSNLSNGLTYGTAAAAGGIYLTGLFTHDEHAQRTGVLSAEAAIDSFLLYGSMKLIFNRQRPYQSVDGKFFAGNFSSGSFPSGHSAFAWTLASVIAHEYPKWPVQLAMYGMATAVATTRVTGGQHFPSDVFVGSTLGFLVGRYVANKDKHADHPAHSGNKFTRLPSAILEHISFQ
jgi:membrane-associated phospholipid phosphatase